MLTISCRYKILTWINRCGEIFPKFIYDIEKIKGGLGVQPQENICLMSCNVPQTLPLPKINHIEYIILNQP